VPDPRAAPDEVASVMAPLGVWWAMAGGWAIDLWLGTITREHHDVEVIIRRSDQDALRRALGGGWEMTCIDPPGSGWRPWPLDHSLAAPAFQTKATRGPVQFDVFLEDVEDGTWRFRRDASVRRPADELVVSSSAGFAVVRPEVQLLYMARHTEPKHDHDFLAVLPALDDPDRAWLAEMLQRIEPGHHWRAACGTAGS
jgi:hypothetical protein